MTQLCWSSNSELLAVVLSQAPSGSPQGPTGPPQPLPAVVQIWHRSNWHWYLKQEQLYPDVPTVTVVWDEVVPLRLHICSGGWYRQVCNSCHLHVQFTHGLRTRHALRGRLE